MKNFNGILKRGVFLVVASLWMLSTVVSQDVDTVMNVKAKDGWNFGGLPIISYDSDLGLQYGALASAYHYGDGTRYPEYDHRFYVEASWYTKGSGIFRFAYESDRLIKNIRLNFDISYLPDEAYDFIGFNGYESVYNQHWIDSDDTDYRTSAYYKMQRKMFKTRVDFAGHLSVKNLFWTAGLEYYNVQLGSVNIDKYNKGKSEEDLLPSVDSLPGLFEEYQTWNLISAKDKEGGNVFGIKAGLMYDSRDTRANPSKGIWTEAGVFYAPSFANDVDKGYLKIYATHRQYLSIVKNRLTFAYRIGYQTSVVNEAPWYAEQFIITSELRGTTSEGLGGSKTLRGIKRNRVVGDGVLYGNLELRWKVVFFKLFGQNIYIGLNGFVDGGQVVKLIPTKDQINALPDENDLVHPPFVKSDYFDVGAEKLHTSYGAGLRFAMNENFIIAVDYGKVMSEKDGGSGLYIGLNYLF